MRNLFEQFVRWLSLWPKR